MFTEFYNGISKHSFPEIQRDFDTKVTGNVHLLQVSQFHLMFDLKK